MNLNKDIIKNNIHGLGELVILDSIDSTNKYAKQLCTQGIADKSLVIARHQTCGRGRTGKSFYSPKDGGLYMTLVFKADRLKSESVQLMTVCAAVAVCRALKAVCNISVGIKWVNDIFYNRRKVCGILCEAVINPKTFKNDYYIAGIGINIGNDKFPQDIENIAGSIYCNPGEESLIAAAIASEMFGIMQNESIEEIISEYRSGLIILNKSVDFTIEGKEYSGIVLDINEKGNLIVKCQQETIILSSGEISLSSSNFIK